MLPPATQTQLEELFIFHSSQRGVACETATCLDPVPWANVLAGTRQAASLRREGVAYSRSALSGRQVYALTHGVQGFGVELTEVSYTMAARCMTFFDFSLSSRHTKNLKSVRLTWTC